MVWFYVNTSTCLISDSSSSSIVFDKLFSCFHSTFTQASHPSPASSHYLPNVFHWYSQMIYIMILLSFCIENWHYEKVVMMVPENHFDQVFTSLSTINLPSTSINILNFFMFTALYCQIALFGRLNFSEFRFPVSFMFSVILFPLLFHVYNIISLL